MMKMLNRVVTVSEVFSYSAAASNSNSKHTDRNFVDNFLYVVIHLALVANI